MDSRGSGGIRTDKLRIRGSLFHRWSDLPSTMDDTRGGLAETCQLLGDAAASDPVSW